MRLLFIGNSATYVNDIPGTLARLAEGCGRGYEVETASITLGGFELRRHADAQTDHGMRVLEAIRKGFDAVIIQDNGNCISSTEMRSRCKDACRKLISEIKKSGSKAYIYVRPPYGYEKFGFSPIGQCREFDILFGEIAKETGSMCICVNRAFAHAIASGNAGDLWGNDNAHTGKAGGYLAVCIFFATLFGESATLLDPNGLSIEEAKTLQKLADDIVFDKVIPW